MSKTLWTLRAAGRAVVDIGSPMEGIRYLRRVHNMETFLPLPEGAKAPPPPGWTALRTDQLDEMCRDHSGNFGVVPGKLLIVDLDVRPGRNGYNALDRHGLELPDTLTVATPSGGLHLYYQSDLSSEQASALRLGRLSNEGIDVRYGRSGYVVAPGSVLRPSSDRPGGTYRIVHAAAVAPCPQALLDILTAPRVYDTAQHATRAVTREEVWRVAEALRRIDPNAQELAGYDAWLSVLMALATLLGPAGEELAHVWCARWFGTHKRPVREVYRSLNPDGRVGLGTLYHWFKKATPGASFDPDQDRVAFDAAVEEACAGLPTESDYLPQVIKQTEADGLPYGPWWDRSKPGWEHDYRDRLAQMGVPVDGTNVDWGCNNYVIELVAASVFRHWAKPDCYSLYAMPATWTRPLTASQLSSVLLIHPATVTEKGAVKKISWDAAFASTRTRVEQASGDCTIVGEYPRKIVVGERFFVNRFEPRALPMWVELARRVNKGGPPRSGIIALWRKQLQRLCGELAESVEHVLARIMKSWWHGHTAYGRPGYALLFHSPVQGLGKSDLITVMASLFRGPGDFVVDFDAANGINRFSLSSLVRSALVRIEEVKSSDDSFVRMLKDLLQRDEANQDHMFGWRTIERKGLDRYAVPYVPPAILASTNKLADIRLEDYQRRLMVVSAPPPLAGWRADAADFHECVVRKCEALTEVHYHLLMKPEPELFDFDCAPLTEGAQTAIAASRPEWQSDLDSVVGQYKLDNQPIFVSNLLSEMTSLSGTPYTRLPRGAVEWLRDHHDVLVGAAQLRLRPGFEGPNSISYRVAARKRTAHAFNVAFVSQSEVWTGTAAARAKFLEAAGVKIPHEYRPETE